MNVLGVVAEVEEDKSTELKEFMIEIDLHKYVEPNEVRRFVRDGIYPPEINLIIEKNLEAYCIKYLPKYFAAFSNTESIDYGTLYFGIRDNSLVTGIPYKGKLIPGMISAHMYQVYDRLRFFQDEERVDFSFVDFLACFDIKVIPLINKIEKDRSLKKLIKLKNKYNKLRKSYHMAYLARQAWKKRFKVYDRKIIVIADDMELRDELLGFVMAHSDAPQSIINTLSLYRSIEIDESEIVERKKNKDDIVYWITEFKDINRQRILAEKPLFPTKPSKEKYLSDIERIFRELYPLACKWKEKINYYVIQINIYQPGFNDFHVEYSKLHGTRYQRWVYQKRFDGKRGPICAEFV